MPPPRIPEPVRRRAEDIQSRLLAWGRANYRDFGWRRPPLTPYRILIAEILLKRTTARAVAGSYEQFLSRYPTPSSLRTATVSDLASMLAPLGLSSQRARAIRSMVGHLLQGEDGDLPDSLEGLIGVPGLGDYSARAVLSFGWNRAAAVVDANVARIISRVFQRSRSLRSSPRAMQAAADALLPKEHREFNFSMLDLGALVCRYARPACEVCPLDSLCDYNARRQPSKAPRSRLRDLRQARGLSLVKLAQAAGVAKMTIVNAEAGRTKPTARTLSRLASALRVPASEVAPPGATRPTSR